ncbi:MAG TPA: nucleotidyltransferase [Anaerolineae bacterium]|nr:nucleotidyltransferase [Anaerolineae bacterium]
MKIVIPMAGLGTRLRPQTWSRPKQLVSIAGKAIIEHVLDTFSTLSPSFDIEYIFIVGYLSEKIKSFMKTRHPELNIHYATQLEMRGQSHAIHLAKEHLTGPMLMVFADTLIETDLSFLEKETADIIGWVKPVQDPRRFGVAKIGEKGWVTRLIEKPMDIQNNLAVVGFYYFKKSEELIDAIEEQMKRNTRLKGEYFLADAINIMIERGAKMRTHRVDVWLDAGTPDAVLETNRFLLEHGYNNAKVSTNQTNTVIIPPVFIHPTATIKHAIIGPHVSIGAECVVEASIIQNTILEDRCRISHVNIENSLIGQNAEVQGKFKAINIGDDTKILT